MFLQQLRDDPLFFFAAALTVVLSITLHELAHGVAALAQGDTTPRDRGHMTLNPIVHMGAFSIILFLVAGIAFGAMPVNPARFRGRHGRAIVAVAGPLANLALAAVALVALGLWIRFAGAWGNEHLAVTAGNGQRVLWIFAKFNVALFILNMLPLPPLDGSSILASFHRGFDRFASRPENMPWFFAGLLAVFFLSERSGWGFFTLAEHAGLAVLNLVSGADLSLTR